VKIKEAKQMREEVRFYDLQKCKQKCLLVVKDSNCDNCGGVMDLPCVLLIPARVEAFKDGAGSNPLWSILCQTVSIGATPTIWGGFHWKKVICTMNTELQYA
jgi:hypothetical protein